MTQDVVDPAGAPAVPGATRARTVCGYCGVGCGIVLDVVPDASGRRVAVRASGDKAHPANAGRLCTKGATSAEVLAAPGRMTTALVRHDRGAEPTPCPTDEAIQRVAAGLRRVIDEHGPQAVSLYVSGQMTIEAQYLANKLAKGFIRTNRIESNSRLCMASAASGYKLSLGADGPPGSYDDIDHADVFLVIGSNMADCHPVLFLRLLDRVRRGAKLVVVDPRRTATADAADLFLQVRPGTDLALLNGLLHLLVTAGDVDEAFIAAHTEGWEAMAPLLADHTPGAVAAATGIAETDLRAAAQLIGGARNWMSLWTMGLNQSVEGTWNTTAICNLHLATGAICRTGSGPMSLTGQPNAMGGREMGYMGPGLPGQRSVLIEADRRFVEALWSLPEGALGQDPGSGTVDLFGRMAAGEIKACWIICTNPIASVAHRSTVIAGLEAAELVVTQDAFADTETNAYADVVLPAAMWAEGDGVMVSSERTLTLVPGVVDPPAGALADWELIARVACAMGFADAFTYASAEEVFEEIRACSNPATGYDLRGATYDRLRSGPVQWPAAPGGPARNPVRHLGADGRPSFPTPSGRAVFHPRAHGSVAERPDAEFPFTFNTGRLAHQWHTMTKTGKVGRLNTLNPAPFVEIHPDDAAGLGVVDGDAVEVASRRGRAVIAARLTDRVSRGSCFAPFHWNDLYGEYASVNAVTSDAVDPVSLQPGFKVCAVALTKVAGGPERPAPPPAPALPAVAPPGVVALPAGAPDLDAAQQRYLAGFVAGVGAPSSRTGVAVLPPGAPFDADATTFLNGFLAGLTSRATPPAGVTATDADAARRTVVVLWASQTGTAEDLAADVAGRLGEEGFVAHLRAMDGSALSELSPASDVLVVVSTSGSGDPPDNGVGFWDALRAPDAPVLDGVRYAVLALGDSSYADFCGFGRRLDERFHELGARRILERVECEPDHGADSRSWLDRAVGRLRTPPAPPDAVRELAGGPFRACEQGQVPTRAAPTLARLAGNRLLTGPTSAKEVRELAVDTTGSALTYEAGDSLGVWPANCPDLTREWVDLLGAAPDDVVELDGAGPVALVSALRDHLEIARVTPQLVRFLGERTHDRDLRRLARDGDAGALATWTWGRQAVDVARAAAVRAPLQAWVDVFARLRPRQYSIASSPLVHPHHVRLVTSVVRFRVGERERKGVCSTYLADGELDALVPVFVQRAPHFRLPADPSRPVVMIGAGTGVAPFLGFLDERRARGGAGPGWLVFGEQRRSDGDGWEPELAAHRADGSLTRLDVAFSRDQQRKDYVQDRLREQGARLWSWIADGAHVYVCGDKARMAHDVDRALHDVLATHGGLGADGAAEHLRAMVAERRYCRDVY